MKLILVVEDEYGNAEVIQRLLEAEGYRVASASNGKEALELLKGELPALILSDFMMPTMHGGELGEQVRRNPALAGIPFIFMSGTIEQVVRQTFRDYDAFLPKPLEVDTLLQLIARFIASGRVQQPTTKEVEDSMRQLLKGIHLPPGD